MNTPTPIKIPELAWQTPLLHELQRTAEQAGEQLCRAFTPPEPQQDTNTPPQLVTSLMQFFALCQNIEEQNDTHAAMVLVNEMPDLIDYGQRLLDELRQWSNQLHCHEAEHSFTWLAVPMARWGVQHQFTLSELGHLVNALSQFANQTNDTTRLVLLTDIFDEIINAINPAIKSDLDRADPARPWRVINLNHGIVATRSHDPQRMEAVFEQLLFRLPDDAPGFFEEGMTQMDKIGYPQHVRSVMEKYHRRTLRPTLH